MRKLTFDSEQLTYCPMNETATREECLECRYFKGLTSYWQATCIKEDVEPELKDFAGLDDCLKVDSIMDYPNHYSPGQPEPFCKPGE